MSIQINLSDDEFFHCFVKNKNWNPLQNHGYFDDKYILKEEDKDFPYQIISYLNLLDNINIKNKNILDIGCGFGRGTYILKTYLNCNITGTDINNNFIQHASNKYKKVTFIVDDFLNTKLKENEYDIIVSNCSSHFFYDKDNFYLNLIKVLKDNGIVLITDIFTKDSINILENKLSKNNLKIKEKIDISNQTIKSMEYDINTLFDRFDKEIINHFYEIQKRRLYLFNTNVNKQYKLIIEK
jgi:ubiquinone/menaquinone biosynthesis C-methylase UbiE